MKITTLIPAYNEEKTIAYVINAVQKTGLVDEIVVVNDGSSDNTSLVAEKAGAMVVNLPKNKGKGAALQKGIEEVDTGIIVMLDGDLVGLKKMHLDRLILPLLEDEADMTVGVFNDGRGLTDLAQMVTPNLSGQRAVKSDIIKGIENLSDSGFGVEIALNQYVKKHGRLKFVELPELTHLMKEEKMGLAKGVAARAKMYWDIVREIVR